MLVINAINYSDYDDVFDLRKIHGDVLESAIETDDCDDSGDDDEEFNCMRFHGINKNYERVNDHCRYTGDYRGLHTISAI